MGRNVGRAVSSARAIGAERMIVAGAFLDDRVQQITLDLPIPPSVNRIWRMSARKNVYRSEKYVKWLKDADALVMAKRQLPKQSMAGHFEVEILIDQSTRGDGDNRIKAVLDYLQSREIITDDKDCRRGCWAFVPTDQAPHGCRVHLKSLSGAAA